MQKKNSNDLEYPLLKSTSSFFHSIQSLFSAEYHGRYLALILSEIGKNHPDCLVDFFSHAAHFSKRNVVAPRFEVEYVFAGDKGHRRRADIALFADSKDVEPLLLVEVKYHDKLTTEKGTKPAQLDDYVAWQTAASNRYLVVLSREQLRLENIAAVRWGSLEKHLKSHAAKSELIQLLVDYLQQEGITMQPIDQEALIKFMKRLVCPPTGNGKLANNVYGPAEFSKLLSNLKYLAGGFDPIFKASWKAAGEKIEGDDYKKNSRGAIVDFGVQQYVKTSEPTKLVDDADMSLVIKQRNGGWIWVSAQYSLGHDTDWLRVSFGVYFEFKPTSKTDEAAIYAFAAIRGAKHEQSKEGTQYASKKIPLALVTEKAEVHQEKFEKILYDLLAKVIDETSDRKLPLNKQQKLAITRLKREFPIQ